MQPEMVRRLDRLRKRAEQLGRLAAEARAAAPEITEGADASGYVLVTLDAARRPLRIVIRDGWQDRLDAGALAVAVMDANADAVRNAYRSWGEGLDDSGWWRRQRDADDDTAGPHTMPMGPPRSGTRPVPEDPETGERILRLLHDARQDASQPPLTDVEGTDVGGNVSVQLAPGGLARCVIAAQWARHRRGEDITAALSHALHQAGRRLTSPWPRLYEADILIEEALAALAAHVDTVPAGGDER